MDEVQNDSVDAVETTEQEEVSTSSQDNVTSSTQAETPEVQEGQATTQPPTDPLSVLESLQLDPKLKEELRNGYLRQADYTKKTQELASVRKTVDEYTQVKPLIDYLNQNPHVFNEIFGRMQGQAQPQVSQEQLPDDPREYAEYVKQNAVKEALQQFQSIQAKEADFRQAAEVDPILKDPDVGPSIARLVASDPEYKQGQISATEATQKAVNMYKHLIAKEVAAAKASLTEKAVAKRTGMEPRTVQGKTATSGVPRSIAEAARMAEEELGS